MLEESKRYLIEAQISYWNEMIKLNKGHIAARAMQDMQRHLTQARRELMELSGSRMQLFA